MFLYCGAVRVNAAFVIGVITKVYFSVFKIIMLFSLSYKFHFRIIFRGSTATLAFVWKIQNMKIFSQHRVSHVGLELVSTVLTKFLCWAFSSFNSLISSATSQSTIFFLKITSSPIFGLGSGFDFHRDIS